MLSAALAWAHLHPAEPTVPTTTGRAGVGGREREIPPAGVGTPTVAEFAVAEFAAELAMTTEAEGCLIGDSLELAHRPPRLWEWIRYVDAHAAPSAHRLSPGRVDRAVHPVNDRS